MEAMEDCRRFLREGPAVAVGAAGEGGLLSGGGDEGKALLVRSTTGVFLLLMVAFRY